MRARKVHPKADDAAKGADPGMPPLDARGLRVGLVVSRYHGQITGALEAGARETFLRAGGRAQDLLVMSAPGAFELPVLCAHLARRRGKGAVAAVVALGCVVRGQTRHDQYINQGVTHALAQLSVERGKPVGYGLLTVETMAQARARAGGREGNKGAEAMAAALQAVRAMQRMES